MVNAGNGVSGTEPLPGDDQDTDQAAEGSSAEAGQPELQRPYDASDPEQVNQRRRDVGRRTRASREVLRNVMSSSQGRAWLWDMLSDCNIFGNPFVPGAHDVTDFNLGEQNAGRRLMSQMLLADAKAFVQMQTENGKGL